MSQGLAPLVFPDQPGMCLVSNGAECVLIEKKLYEAHCPKHLSQRLKTEVSRCSRSLRQRCNVAQCSAAVEAMHTDAFCVDQLQPCVTHAICSVQYLLLNYYYLKPT